jgi:hypothetical protein
VSEYGLVRHSRGDRLVTIGTGLALSLCLLIGLWVVVRPTGDLTWILLTILGVIAVGAIVAYLGQTSRGLLLLGAALIALGATPLLLGGLGFLFIPSVVLTVIAAARRWRRDPVAVH